MTVRLSAAVLGASGYAGGEVVRLLDDHPVFDVVHLGAHSLSGRRLGEVHPHLAGGDRVLSSQEPDAVPEVDVVFLALPHGASWEIGHALAERGCTVVDLGSDYRLDTDARYRDAYGSAHPLPDQLGSWRYGLPELFDLAGADRIAAPGCYPTAVVLCFAPLLAAGLVQEGAVVVADCLSGVSGAGRGVKESLLFGAIDEGVQAYKVTEHRHRPEIEMALGAASGREPKVVFTPHLVPMLRGELATVTAPLARLDLDARDARGILADAYAGRPFVEIIDTPPQTRWAVSSNRAFLTAFVDHHAGVIIAQGAIDNLVKGAAGQAVQAANIAFGLPEETGLPLAGWMP
ncbi:MAG TPA: N-acetyl-gamma-glutamyl-phosphate reductase [Acidimicrobiia bacterium]